MTQWLLVIAGAAGAFVFLVHRAEHNHPAASAPSVAAPVIPQVVEPPTLPTHRVSVKPTLPTHRVSVINGSRLLQFGSQFTLSGGTAPVSGVVRIVGRWNSGAWQTFAVANANGRPFSFTFPVNHHGTLRIKIVQPNGDVSVGTYHVS